VTARQHLASIARSAQLGDDRVDEVLAIVELDRAADRRIGNFSTGMAQRCALAVALLGQPRILLLDEPANGLDPAGIRWLRQFLRASADDGVAVFVSTHQLAELEPIVDRVVVLHEGRCLHDATPQELLRLSDTARLDDALLALTSEQSTTSHDAYLSNNAVMQ
jgi:ABC-2 type transport system ATP-binding protein